MADTIEKKVLIDIEVINKNSNEIKKLTEDIKVLQARQVELKASNKETSAQFIENANTIKVYSNRIREINKDVANQILSNYSSEGSLTSLKAQVSSLTIAYNRLSEAERNEAAGKELQTKILTLTDTLNKAEQATGNYRRQVGNYAQANSRLSFSMAQIIREAPVAAMRMDMFFLAISNNIPMLADEIKKMKDLNVQLKANGEATQSLSKSLLKSFLSFNTAMMIGVTLLTMYGGKIIDWTKSLFENKDAVQAQQKALKESAETYKYTADKAKNAASELAKLNLLYSQWTSIKDNNLKERQKWFDEHKESLAKVGKGYKDLKSLEKDWAVNGIKNYQEGIMKRAEASAAFNKLVELYERRLVLTDKERLKDLTAWQREVNSLGQNARNIQKQITEIENNIKSKKIVESDAVLIQLRGLRNQLKWAISDSEDLQKKIKEGEIATIASNAVEVAAIDKKINSLSKVADIKEENANKEIEVTNNTAKSLLDIQKDTAISAIKAEEDYQSEDFSIKQAYAKRIFELEQTYAKKKITEDLTNKEITLEQSKLKEEQLLNQKTEFNNKQKAEQDKYNLEEQKKLDEQQKKLLELLSDYGEDQIKAINDKWDNYIKDFSKTLAPPKNNVEAWKEWALKISMFTFAANKKRAEEIAKYNEGVNDKETKERLEALNKQLVDEDKTLKEKFDLKMAYFDQEIALANKDATLQAQLQKDKLKTEKEYYRERGKLATDYASEVLNVLTAINDFANAQSESELQDYETKNEEKKASLDNQLQQGLISQQEYDNQVAAMDKDLDKKKAKIAREQAAREKLLKIFEITINTASAIMKAAPNIPLQILTGIAGAAQLAAVIAAPLPKAARGKYIQGNSHAQGGTMIEAEGGEVIINKASTAQYLPLLSAINVAGGGVPFGNFTDGGFAMRNDRGSVLDTTTLERAIKDMQIVVSVEDINRGQKNYAKVIDRASF